MEADFTTDHAATARLRRPGSGTFQRAAGTLSTALRGEQSLRLLSDDARAVFSFVETTGDRRFRTTARRDDAEEPVAFAGCGFITGSINERRFSTNHR